MFGYRPQYMCLEADGTWLETDQELIAFTGSRLMAIKSGSCWTKPRNGMSSQDNIRFSSADEKCVVTFSISIYISLGSSWSWPYHSWIYSYLCNQCISLLELWVQIPVMVWCTRNNCMWKSLSMICGRSVFFSGCSGFLQQ